MRLSVVIATKDRAGYLERAIDSLCKQIATPAYEIVVVDNGSSDRTKEVVESFARRGRPVRYVYESEPNRGKARNRGVDVASGYVILFCDDDVQAPPGFLSAHDAAHTGSNLVVNGPILNVPSYDDRPKPSALNYSRAFLCTCNVSLPRHAIAAVGGFDESFDLYGWEDTELGVRLRDAGLEWRFAWDAYLWHVKPPRENTLHIETAKALEKAHMAARFVRKQPSSRSRMAAGAHPANLWRATYLMPDAWLALLAGVATNDAAPTVLRALARAQFLDGMYTKELVRTLARGAR